MNMNYTQEASDRCFALFDKETEQMWEDIASASESSDKEQWKAILEKIAREFAISSRFALMRLCQKWACPDEEGKAYSVNVGGKNLHFSDFSFEHAEDLGQEELNAYELLLLDRAAIQMDADLDNDRQLIRKALAINIGKKKQSLLTREEALKLGHILNFSFADMQWFLLRALDMGEGFRYNASEDLIEAYGFLISTSWQHVVDIKKQYAKKAEQIEKCNFSDKPVDWTRSINASLPELIATWDAANCDMHFLDWMEKQSPYLDIPSKSATRIYRDLAVYAYNMIRGEESAPADSDFVLVVRQIVSAKEEDDHTVEVLCDNGILSKVKCKELASMLLLENLNFTLSDQTDKAKAWHYLKMKNGKLSASGGIDVSRTRVQELLTGSVIIEKADMLYMLWFLANMCWFDNDDNPTTNTIFNRLADFIDASEICLDQAMLPGFYPPHALEQSMMLAIVFGGASGRDPAEIYEEICSTVIGVRAKHTNKKNK